MSLKFKIIFFAIYLIISALHARAQFFGEGFDNKRSASYAASDIIYVYNETPVNWNTKFGILKAISPDSTSGWTFTFQVYNPVNKTFRDSLSFTNDSSRTFTNLLSGGYRIRMQKDAVDTFYRAWIFINKLRFYLVKDENGYVKDFEYTCTTLDLRGIAKNDNKYPDSLRFYHEDFIYYHPVSGAPYPLKNDMKNRWVGSTGEPEVNNRISVRIYDPPAENTTYTVTIRDTFGNTVTDKVIYKTINTKAEFEIHTNTATYYYQSDKRLDPFKPDTSRENYKLVPEGQEGKAEAPLHAMFVNKSKNGIRFEWLLADSIFSPIDSARYFTEDSMERVYHIYRNPYKYKLRLISESPYGCIDTSEYKNLEVENSQMGDGNGDGAFPTAFSPDSKTSQHQYFFLKSELSSIEKTQTEWKSIRTMRLWIFNQWGKEMYRYEGDMYSGWKGWDGKTKWGLEASQGVYYYVFEAIGWGKFIKTNSAPAEGEGQEQETGQTMGSHRILGKGYVFLVRDPNK